MKNLHREVWQCGIIKEGQKIFKGGGEILGG